MLAPCGHYHRSIPLCLSVWSCSPTAYPAHLQVTSIHLAARREARRGTKAGATSTYPVSQFTHFLSVLDDMELRRCMTFVSSLAFDAVNASASSGSCAAFLLPGFSAQVLCSNRTEEIKSYSGKTHTHTHTHTRARVRNREVIACLLTIRAHRAMTFARSIVAAF